MQKIKNILFDLGGVLLDIDFNLSNKAFAQLGVPDFKQYISQHHADDLFEKLEIGAVSPDEFYDAFREKANLSASNEDIEQAWNAMLLHFSKDKMDWLDAVGKRYNVYLFSNTNKMHTGYFRDLCVQEIGKPLDSFFIKAWFSNEVGIRKPYPASFTKLLTEENLKPEETLFIDDTIGNIEGAKQAGLQTLHLVAPETILDLQL